MPSGVVKQVELCGILRYVWSFLCVVYYNRYDLVRSYTHIYRVKSVYNDCIHVGWGRAARARRGARGARRGGAGREAQAWRRGWARAW